MNHKRKFIALLLLVTCFFVAVEFLLFKQKEAKLGLIRGMNDAASIVLLQSILNKDMETAENVMAEMLVKDIQAYQRIEKNFHSTGEKPYPFVLLDIFSIESDLCGALEPGVRSLLTNYQATHNNADQQMIDFKRIEAECGHLKRAADLPCDQSKQK